MKKKKHNTTGNNCTKTLEGHTVTKTNVSYRAHTFFEVVGKCTATQSNTADDRGGEVNGGRGSCGVGGCGTGGGSEGVVVVN